MGVKSLGPHVGITGEYVGLFLGNELSVQPIEEWRSACKIKWAKKTLHPKPPEH